MNPNLHSLEILTLEEAADYLRIPIELVKQRAEEGKIPGRCIKGTWYFSKMVSKEGFQSQNMDKPVTNKFAALLTEDRITVDRLVVMDTVVSVLAHRYSSHLVSNVSFSIDLLTERLNSVEIEGKEVILDALDTTQRAVYALRHNLQTLRKNIRKVLEMLQSDTPLTPTHEKQLLYILDSSREDIHSLYNAVESFTESSEESLPNLEDG